MLRADETFVGPSTDVVTHIIIPTIGFCIGMVVAMLIGINKCKQWELDKVVEIRRTRLTIQRLTARLRERNCKAIQKARDVRKRAIAAKEARSNPSTSSVVPPPLYRLGHVVLPTGNSPPPSYEDSLLDKFFMECVSLGDDGRTIGTE
ncbi:hypothetical protein GPALN_012793 [Globodera pallida]|uniref:Transmembrane protein n=1 Tax=Globodera pallida TaxID=36090 RepID=A0A183BTJ3_GLOPA|nr:hypothetical protein GPALN_012793 [Globodera pallida]